MLQIWVKVKMKLPLKVRKKLERGREASARKLHIYRPLTLVSANEIPEFRTANKVWLLILNNDHQV